MERYVSLAPFDCAHVRPVETADFRKLLLRNADFIPKPTDVSRNDFIRIGMRHGDIL